MLELLRSKVPTRRVNEKDTPTPDFECGLPDGHTFFVEVKSLDIAGGALRHDSIMVDAIDQAGDLKKH